jgi:hypothetical protein
MTKWEYYQLRPENQGYGWILEYKGNLLDYDPPTLDKILVELGQEGWELVSAMPITGFLPLEGITDDIYTATVAEVYIFKRPIER